MMAVDGDFSFHNCASSGHMPAQLNDVRGMKYRNPVHPNFFFFCVHYDAIFIDLAPH